MKERRDDSPLLSSRVGLSGLFKTLALKANFSIRPHLPQISNDLLHQGKINKTSPSVVPKLQLLGTCRPVFIAFLVSVPQYPREHEHGDSLSLCFIGVLAHHDGEDMVAWERDRKQGKGNTKRTTPITPLYHDSIKGSVRSLGHSLMIPSSLETVADTPRAEFD